MCGKVTFDRAGRIVLPKNLRDELDLSPGDTLDVTVQGGRGQVTPAAQLLTSAKEARRMGLQHLQAHGLR